MAEETAQLEALSAALVEREPGRARRRGSEAASSNRSRPEGA